MSTFYNKFKEEQKEQEQKLVQKNIVQEKQIQQNYNQPIFIENKSSLKNFIRFLVSAFLFLTKSLFYISITIFSSIGLTILLNESLRNSFIQFVKTVL